MDHRRTTATRSRSVILGPMAALLAALLALTGGPGLAASSTRPTTDPARTRIADQLGTDPIGDQALALDYDLDTIYRFVADEIAYQPYTGILRGAAGTLQARAGNSVDKALLLAALLDASLIPYRFAQGPLDDATAAQLLVALPADPDTAKTLATLALDVAVDRVTALGAPAGPADPEIEQLGLEPDDTVKADGQAAFEQAAARLGDTAALIESALADSGITLPAADPTLPASELTGHTWVQAQFGPDWQDLDPTLAGTEPGTTLTTPTETLEQLPDDLRYRIGFDVLVEKVAGDELVTGSVLQHEEFADALNGVPVVFGHVTPDGLKSLGVTLGALFGDGWIDYRPTLDFGGRAIVADDAVGIPSGTGGDIFAADPSPSADGTPVEGEATAEWLEVTVTPPGGDPIVARRPVFDRVPADVRASGTPTVTSVEPLVLTDLDGNGTPGFAPMEGVEAFAIATGPTTVAPLLATTEDGLGMLALAYHNLRDVMSGSMALDAGARSFIDSPNVVSVAIRIDPDATATDLGAAARFGLDIWHRSHGVLPVTGSPIASGQAELLAGITDHLAERFALDFAAKTPLISGTPIGVGDVFEAAAAQGIPTVVIQGSVPGDLALGPVATAAIGAEVAAGHVVVVPATPVTIGDTERVGWWAVDPATGAATDRMDDGTASEFAEYGFVVRTRIGLVRCYGALAAVVVGYLAAASSALTVMNIMSDFAPGAGAAATCAAL